jgi:UMF1 family MFS transporter
MNNHSNRQEIFGWQMYDWANSAFSTTVTAVFLSPYLTNLAKAAADANGLVHIWGIPIAYDSFWAYCVSLSVLLQVLILPILGAIADYSQLRKTMLVVFANIGALATILLCVVSGNLWGLGGVLFIIANLSFGVALVFYNAYLPDIAAPADRDKVSSRGFALGYLGGGLLLLLNLMLFNQLADKGLAIRINLASAGVWWLLFGQYSFTQLKPRQARRPLPAGENYLSIGFKQLSLTLRTARLYPQTLLFLLAYLIYNDGVQTVINISAVYGSEELKIGSGTLALVILMVQFLAIGGSLLFEQLAKRTGTKWSIVISLVIWAGLTVYAYAFLQTTTQFFGMAAVLALVLGGSQALSRSLFSQMIPLGRESEFFSFYEISERGTSWLGPLLFGVVNQITGSLRLGILSLLVFFVVGLIILVFVNVQQAITQAQQHEPA